MDRRLLLAGIMTALGVGAAACGFADTMSGGPDAVPVAGPDASAPTNVADAGPKSEVPPEDGIILVHAANAPAFRLCFTQEGSRKPQPDAQLMPAANVVGVDVGGAVRIPSLRTSAFGRVFLFSEPIIRGLYGPGTQEPTCEKLLDDENTSKLSVELGPLDVDLSTGLHVLAVTGCPGETPTAKYTKEECGPSYTGQRTLALRHVLVTDSAERANRTLPAQVIQLSLPLEIARAGRRLDVRFGDLRGPDDQTALLREDVAYGTPTPLPRAPLALPFDPNADAVYENLGVRIGFTDVAPDGGDDAGGDGGDAGAPSTTKIADATLATIARLSAPRELPADLYARASSYVFLVLGSPAPAFTDGGGIDPDELRNVHVIVVPVARKNDADGGEGGTSDAATDDAATDGGT